MNWQPLIDLLVPFFIIMGSVTILAIVIIVLAVKDSPTIIKKEAQTIHVPADTSVPSLPTLINANLMFFGGRMVQKLVWRIYEDYRNIRNKENEERKKHRERLEKGFNEITKTLIEVETNVADHDRRIERLESRE